MQNCENVQDESEVLGHKNILWFYDAIYITFTRLGTIWKGRKTLLRRVKQSYFFQKEEQKEGKKEEYALFLTN